MSWSAWRATMVASVLVAAACAGGTPSGRDGARGAAPAAYASPGCIVGRVPLTVGDDTFAYIEHEGFFQVESGFVVVGTPTYTWAVGADGVRFRESQDAHLAAKFGLDGRATLFEKPVDVPIGSAQTVRLGGDRWGVLFDELHPDSIDQLSRSQRLWYAEHDGVRWTTIESVPFPELGRPEMTRSSDLVRTDEGLTWVAAIGLPDGFTELMEYNRRGGGWTIDPISDDWVEQSALAFAPGTGLVLAHFAHDTELPGFQKSYRLFRKSAGGWDLVRRLAVGEPGSLVWTMHVAVVGDDPAVGWYVDARSGAGAYVAHGLDADGDRAPTRLDASAFQIVPLGPDRGRAAWLVRHVDAAEERAELRLFHTRAGGAVELTAAAPSPYAGSAAAMLTAPSEALVIGAEVSLDPMNGYVRSLILRLTPSCV